MGSGEQVCNIYLLQATYHVLEKFYKVNLNPLVSVAECFFMYLLAFSVKLKHVSEIFCAYSKINGCLLLYWILKLEQLNIS